MEHNKNSQPNTCTKETKKEDDKDTSKNKNKRIGGSRSREIHIEHDIYISKNQI